MKKVSIGQSFWIKSVSWHIFDRCSYFSWALDPLQLRWRVIYLSWHHSDTSTFTYWKKSKRSHLLESSHSYRGKTTRKADDCVNKNKNLSKLDLLMGHECWATACRPTWFSWINVCIIPRVSSNLHAYAHTDTDTHTHTHVQTHIHTHAQRRPP